MADYRLFLCQIAPRLLIVFSRLSITSLSHLKKAKRLESICLFVLLENQYDSA